MSWGRPEGGLVWALKAEIDKQDVVLGLNQKDAFCEFTNLEGEDGGRAELRLTYSLIEDLAKLRLFINGEDHSLINLLSTGSLDTNSNDAFITVRFKAGKENSIRLAQALGTPHIRSLSVKLLDMKPDKFNEK